MLENRLTDQDLAMLARGQNGETLRAVATEFGVSIEMVRREEWRARKEAEGRELLAADPESLHGLRLIGEMSWGLGSALTTACYHDGPTLERLSEVAAAGRVRVMRIDGIGQKAISELDKVLERHGLTWGPDPTAAEIAAEKAEWQPAGPMVDGWNIIDFPTGRARLETMTHNTASRARWCTLSREIGNFQGLLIEATGEKNRFNRHINAMIDGMSGLFDELDSRRILAEEEPS